MSGGCLRVKGQFVVVEPLTVFSPSDAIAEGFVILPDFIVDWLLHAQPEAPFAVLYPESIDRPQIGTGELLEGLISVIIALHRTDDIHHQVPSFTVCLFVILRGE